MLGEQLLDRAAVGNLALGRLAIQQMQRLKGFNWQSITIRPQFKMTGPAVTLSRFSMFRIFSHQMVTGTMISLNLQ